MSNPIPPTSPELDEAAFDAAVDDATSFLSDGIEGPILTSLVSLRHELSPEDVEKAIVVSSQIVKSRNQN
jgi:hypothetical protein